jgi:hypothetical protein
MPCTWRLLPTTDRPHASNSPQWPRSTIQPTRSGTARGAAAAYYRSAAALQAAAARPGVLERSQATPVGVAIGVERLHWRIVDPCLDLDGGLTRQLVGSA